MLLPSSWLYCLLVLLRRALYRLRLRRVVRVSVPVIVVGNITVGGTGKTPLVLWLTSFLKEKGYRPGVVSRGYGGRVSKWPVRVQENSSPAEVGDEPVLLARRGTCPVMVGLNRASAAEALVREHDCNVVVSDDGLQHYALARDVEIAVIDGNRRFGNGHCLPAGPLREPIGRLRQVHARVTNGRPDIDEFGMEFAEICFRRVASPNVERPVNAFAGQRVRAIAGIGDPERFFEQLRRLEIEPLEHPFPDHHRFQPGDVRFEDQIAVIMTEKDAVKCEPFVDDRHWYLAVEARPEPNFGAFVLNLLEEKTRGQKAA